MNLRFVFIVSMLILPCLGWAANREEARMHQAYMRQARTEAWVFGMSRVPQSGEGFGGRRYASSFTVGRLGASLPTSPEGDGDMSEGMYDEVDRWLCEEVSSQGSSSPPEDGAAIWSTAAPWGAEGGPEDDAEDVSLLGHCDSDTLMDEVLNDADDLGNMPAALVANHPAANEPVAPWAPVWVPLDPELPRVSAFVSAGDPLFPYVRKNWLRKGWQHWFILYDFSHWEGMRAMCLDPIMQLLTATPKPLKRKKFLKWRKEIRKALGPHHDEFLAVHDHLTEDDLDALRMLMLLMGRKRGSYMRIIKHPLI